MAESLKEWCESNNNQLLNEWNTEKNGEISPADITTGSCKKVWWVCKNGHEWSSMVSSRVRGSGCPYCSGKTIMHGYNDLATINPELSSEWHPTKNGDLKPSDVSSKSSKKVWWLGKCGHEWEASISQRIKGTSCPICHKKSKM